MNTITIAQQSIDPLHIILVIFGALLYNLLEVDRLVKSNTKFVFKKWVSLNWVAIIISGISISAMFLLRDDLKQLMGFDMSNRMGCFLAGFTVHTFVSKLNSIVTVSKNNI